MIKNYLRPVKSVTKTFSINNFNSLTEFNCGFDNNGNMLKRKGGFSLTGVSSKKIEKLYNVNGRLYAYLEDKSLAKLNMFGFETVLEQIPVKPFATEIFDKGVRKAFFTWNGNGVIVGDELTHVSGMVASGIMAFYSGRLFIADGEMLYMSKPYNFNTKEVSEMNYDLVASVKDYGKIISLLQVKGELYVVYSYGIFKFRIEDNQRDYNFYKLDTEMLEIDKNTVGLVGNKILFCSMKCLYVLENDKLKRTDKEWGKDIYYPIEKCAVYGYKYIVPVSRNGQGQYLYIYDTNEDKGMLVNSMGKHLADGGYVTGADEKKVHTINDNSEYYGTAHWESKHFDMDTTLKKSILEISCISTTNFKLVLKSGAGNYSYQFVKGYNRKKINIPSLTYKMEIESGIKDTVISKFKIKYRLMEE